MNAAIDTNSKQTAIARLKTDGITPTRLIASTSTKELQVTTDTSSAVVPVSYAASDDNGRTSMFAVSELDGVSLVALQCDSLGTLLIKKI